MWNFFFQERFTWKMKSSIENEKAAPRKIWFGRCWGQKEEQ